MRISIQEWNVRMNMPRRIIFEKNSIVSTNVLSEATDKFIDSNLKLNGVKSGMDNYNEVVRLLILYYDNLAED